MGKNFLIDTNVVIDFSHGIFPENAKKFLSKIKEYYSVHRPCRDGACTVSTLLTRNVNDFKNIDNLDIVNPHEM
jgi:predicted nucleic acid-binding protein